MIAFVHAELRWRLRFDEYVLIIKSIGATSDSVAEAVAEVYKISLIRISFLSSSS